VIVPVNYFLVLTSIIVHGITIPVGKSFHMVRTRTFNISSTPPSASVAGKKTNIRDLLPFSRVGISRTATLQAEVGTPALDEGQESGSMGPSERTREDQRKGVFQTTPNSSPIEPMGVK
jgi:hypothetical protein